MSNPMAGVLLIGVGLVLVATGVFVLNRNTTGHVAVETVTLPEAPQPSPVGVTAPVEALQRPDEPTPIEKGRAFETWIVSKFRPSFFSLKEWRSDKFAKGIYPESSRFPDLEVEFRMRDRTAIFAVECKWRRSFDRGQKPGLEWATREQITIYQQFQKDRHIPVFVVIGVGGEPDRPDELYLLSLDRLRYPFASAEYLAPFRRTDPTRDFYYDVERAELK